MTQEHPDPTPAPTDPGEPDEDLAALEREERELAELEHDLDGIEDSAAPGPGPAPDA